MVLLKNLSAQCIIFCNTARQSGDGRGKEVSGEIKIGALYGGLGGRTQGHESWGAMASVFEGMGALDSMLFY